MRLTAQIFMIAFVILSLVIVKDDIKTVYNKTTTYVKSNLKDLKLNIPSLSDIQDTATSSWGKLSQNSLSGGSTTVSSQIDTPGALRAQDNNVLPANEEATLSRTRVISSTNESRKDNGNLAPLKESATLNLSAKKKLDDMFSQQYFEHISPQGKGVSDVASQAGYEYIIIGENLALGNFKNDQALVDAWMASPGHRANILNSHYTEIGVAVGRGMFEGRETWLAVQHFGLPRSACPTIDKVLNAMITASQRDVKNLENELATRKERIESGAVYNGYTRNEQIDQYNNMVNVYNQAVVELKQKISDYNTQIRAFNSCLESNNNTAAIH